MLVKRSNHYLSDSKISVSGEVLRDPWTALLLRAGFSSIVRNGKLQCKSGDSITSGVEHGKSGIKAESGLEHGEMLGDISPNDMISSVSSFGNGELTAACKASPASHCSLNSNNGLKKKMFGKCNFTWIKNKNSDDVIIRELGGSFLLNSAFQADGEFNCLEI